MGDDIQAIKAGILEIADLFVVNKADRPGADRVIADLDTMLSFGAPDGRPRPEIVRTVAADGTGVGELVAAIDRFLAAAGGARRAGRRRERAQNRFLTLLSERLMAKVVGGAFADEELGRAVEEIAERRVDPYTAVERVLARVEVR
jgi:LAO/AO transport system kinase